MKRRKKSNLIYPYFNNDNVDVYINNPLEAIFQDLDTKQILDTLKTHYRAKRLLTLFKRIRKDIISDPKTVQKLCTLTDLDQREFIKQFINLFADSIDETLVSKLHDVVVK